MHSINCLIKTSSNSEKQRPPSLHTLILANDNNKLFRHLIPGRLLTDVSGDARETMYLFKRVSLAVQRYNWAAFKGTFTVPTELD